MPCSSVGKQIRRSLKTTDAALARRRLGELRNKVSRLNPVKGASKITFADLSNIGTLFAFVLVSVGVIVLRYREPERRRGFRVPFGPIIPALSVIFCFLLMAGLPIITWMRFLIWLAIGLVIYFLYSRHRSEFAGLR